jgi:hypothetical protein
MNIFKKQCQIILMFIIISFFSSCTRSEVNAEQEKQSSLLENPSDITGNQYVTDTQPVMDINDFVWIVEPTLEYDEVYYCTLCGYTANSFTFIIDKSTGQIVGDHDGHGGPYYKHLLYDSKNEMFGLYRYGWDEMIEIHPINDFTIHFPAYKDSLNYVKQVDFKNIIKVENDDWDSYNLGIEHENSKYAISYGSTLLTEFIYDSPVNLTASLEYKNAIPVVLNGKWGFIDTNGILILLLIFDHVASSNGDTAFVKINGKYGIVDVLGSAHN